MKTRLDYLLLCVLSIIVLSLNLSGIFLGLCSGLFVLLVGKAARVPVISKYGLNILISFDQLANAIFGGDVDETISSRVGKLKHKRVWASCLARFLDFIDPGHSDKTQEADEGSDGVVE